MTMAATLTATPEPSTVSEDGRPRIRLDITTTEPMSSVTIFRDGVPLREQPVVAGLTESYIYDYEAPFGEPVTYSMEGEYAGGWTQVLEEDWANLTGWDITKAPMAVDSGRLRTPTETTQGGEVRTTDPTWDAASPEFMIEVRNISGLTGLGSDGFYLSWDDVTMTVFWEGAYLDVYGKVGYNSPLPLTINTFRVTFRDGTMVLEVTGMPTATFPRSHVVWSGPGPQHLSVGVFGKAKVGGITMWANPLSGGSFTGSVYSVMLEEPGVWLIHPSDNNLSVQLDDGNHTCDDLNIDPTTAAEVDRPESRTVFAPEGRRESVVYPQGQRKFGAWPLVINTQTLSARNRLGWLTLDQFPLLLRSHPDLGYDLPDGWYSVGGITEKRISENLQYPGRQITLPMERTAQPPLTVIPAYSWGDAYVSGVSWGVLNQYGWFDVYMGDLS